PAIRSAASRMHEAMPSERQAVHKPTSPMTCDALRNSRRLEYLLPIGPTPNDLIEHIRVGSIAATQHRHPRQRGSARNSDDVRAMRSPACVGLQGQAVLLWAVQPL